MGSKAHKRQSLDVMVTLTYDRRGFLVMAKNGNVWNAKSRCSNWHAIARPWRAYRMARRPDTYGDCACVFLPCGGLNHEML